MNIRERAQVALEGAKARTDVEDFAAHILRITSPEMRERICIIAGLAGKVQINDKPLPPILGALVAPVIALLLGAVFLFGGALLCAPLLAWWGLR